MNTTTCMAEAFKFGIMVPSILDTLMMVVRALATTSGYAVMVCSKWGRDTSKMERDGEEAHITRKMALRRSMTGDGD